jgi:hypothetical protein
MSSITDVLVVTGLGNERGITQANAWLDEHDPRGQQLREIDLGNAGGIKAPCVRLWAAAFKGLDIDGLTAAIRDAAWDTPRTVVAYFDSDERDDTFVVSPARPDAWTTREPSRRNRDNPVI